MVAYMSEAADNGDWFRPSLNSVDKVTWQTVHDNADTKLLYRLSLGDASILAYRIVGTNDALHVRRDTERDTYRMAFFGETCADIRYWLLQAEINDFDVTVHYIAPDAWECMMSVQPPEWKSDLEELRHRYSA